MVTACGGEATPNAAELAAVAALIAPAEANPGTWRARAGAVTYLELSPEASALVDALHRCRLPLARDWTTVAEDARAYEQCPDRLSRAPLQVLRQLLDYHLRADRYVEGHLARTIGSGHLGSIIRQVLSRRPDHD